MANQIGVYGTPGVASGTNAPGGRQEAVGWADAAGNLWLFGGEGEDGNNPPTVNGILDDLWVYNITAKQWTFVMGDTKANQTGVYEAQTVVGPVNTTGAASTCGLTVGLMVGSNVICSPVSTTGAFPGSRWGASGWTDAGGNLWLYGGWGLDSTGTNGNGALNDLWVYTPNSTAGLPGTWTWIKGSNTGAANGVYGDELRPYKTYELWTPGGRSNATHWVDGNGQLWLFGGVGYDSTSTTGNGYLNDMWRALCVTGDSSNSLTLTGRRQLIRFSFGVISDPARCGYPQRAICFSSGPALRRLLDRLKSAFVRHTNRMSDANRPPKVG